MQDDPEEEESDQEREDDMVLNAIFHLPLQRAADAPHPWLRDVLYNDLLAARVMALILAREVRIAVNDLEVERDFLRQEVIDRGFLEPDLDDLERLNRNRRLGNQVKQKTIGPKSLTNVAAVAVVNGLNTDVSDFCSLMEILPSDIVYKIYKQMFSKQLYTSLSFHWKHVEIFNKLLMLETKRIKVHKLFEEVKNSVNISIPERLLSVANSSLTIFQWRRNYDEVKRLYDFLLRLAVFFLESLTFTWAEKALNACKSWFSRLQLSLELQPIEETRLNYYLLMYCTDTCNFDEAKLITDYFDSFLFKNIRENDFKLKNIFDYGQILIQCAVLWSRVGDYKKAMQYVVDALKTVAYRKTPLQTLVNVFRLSARILMKVYCFDLGLQLIKYAIHIAFYEYKSYRAFPYVLIDYAYCLMELNYLKDSVSVYLDGITFLENIYGTSSVCLSQAYEEIASALYRFEYIGNFSRANHYVEKAISLNKLYYPVNHMSIATCRQVKAQIMIKQALNQPLGPQKFAMLKESSLLLSRSLRYYQNKFGEENLLTAEAYQSLGRSYKSLHDVKASEEMYMKAIQIKKAIVGENDYGVAVSLLHLAELYTDTTDHLQEAKELYLESDKVATELLGDTAPGLRNIYRGLHRVSVKLGDREMAQNYQAKLFNFNEKRRQKRETSSFCVWADIPFETAQKASDVALECLKQLSVIGYD